jgi:hypothetical protein
MAAIKGTQVDPATQQVLLAVLADLTALKTQLAQLITDYNGNATIATDTTAVAPTLTTTAS